MLENLRKAFQTGARDLYHEIASLGNKVDVLQEEILRYLGAIRREPLSDHESREFLTLMSASDYVESIGDVVDSNLLEAGTRILDRSLSPSPATTEIMSELYDLVEQAVSGAMRAVREHDQNAAQEVIALKGNINYQLALMKERQAERLSQDGPDRPTLFRVEMEVVDGLKRIYTLAKRIAKAVLREEEKSIDAA
jgi:phosphate:Na+ symporter